MAAAVAIVAVAEAASVPDNRTWVLDLCIFPIIMDIHAISIYIFYKLSPFFNSDGIISIFLFCTNAHRLPHYSGHRQLCLSQTSLTLVQFPV